MSQTPQSTHSVHVLMKRLLSTWAALKFAPLPRENLGLREAVLEAILPYAFPQLDGAELADDVWQTAMSWFSTGDVMTSNMLDRFQTNLNQEVSHAAQSWVSYQTSRLKQATEALESLASWWLSGDLAARDVWMTIGMGFDWWVTAGVLQPSHKKVCLALLSSGLLEREAVQAAWERVHHPLVSRQHKRRTSRNEKTDWKADPWPEDWSVAWEHGRLSRRFACEANETPNETLRAL